MRAQAELPFRRPAGFPARFLWNRQGRKGQWCRVLIRAPRMGSVLVEFPDGYRMVTLAKGLLEGQG